MIFIESKIEQSVSCTGTGNCINNYIDTVLQQKTYISESGFRLADIFYWSSCNINVLQGRTAFKRRIDGGFYDGKYDDNPILSFGLSHTHNICIVNQAEEKELVNSTCT